MLVLKFGGTSVGTVDSIKSLLPLLEAYLERHQLVVVVSAMSGVTNQFVGAIEAAEKGDTKYRDTLEELEVKHIEASRELIASENQSAINVNIKQILTGVEKVLEGIFALKESTPNAIHQVTSAGEALSSLIIGEYFKQSIPDTFLIDPRQIITCSENQKPADVLMEISREKAKKVLPELPKLSLCPGFIAADEKGKLITLGRGGSDYTAALLANFFDAEKLEIWSDVDGLMTADPRLVPNAHLIETLSFEEALELSHFGAKVLYPPSIQPAMAKDISIQIRNTFNQENGGTEIIRGYRDEFMVRGISSVKNISMLNLKGASMVGIPYFSYRLFQTLSEQKINIILITQASSEHTICVAIETKDQARAVKAINKTFAYEIESKKLDPVEVENGLAIIALVGSNMKNQVGISGQLFNTLGKNGISAIAIAQGSSERNISVVINQKDLTKSINSLHETFFEDEIKRVNLFMIGVGNVGKALLNQIKQQQKFLLQEHLLDLQIIGVANSKKMAFLPEGEPIELNNWEKKLTEGEPFTIEGFIDKMSELNLRNSVFLDVTASHEIAESYAEILRRSISIVTPNKIAATSSQSNFQKLKAFERKYKAQYLFETNVCAGLPVISTLRDLIKSGDRIHKIEAVLSGTLNFLFNNYDGTTTFSSIVKRAKDEGYSEPDPRLDLSGEDVRRKILILARESGYELEMDDIQGESFVPQSCMDANDVEGFFKELEKSEEHFQNLQEEAKKNGTKIRYVASFENGLAKTQLKYVNSNHPFYHLEGSDNIVLFFTDRYSVQPLVVKGAGAGAEVTASGIFADIMKISSGN